MGRPLIVDKLNQVKGTFSDFVRRRGDPEWQETLRAALGVAPSGIATLLPWMLRTREGKRASLARVVVENARQHPHGLAFEMGSRQLTWAELDVLTSRIARALSARGVLPGDVVVLLGENSPDYLAMLLGISRAGATASLVNHHLEHAPLGHAIRSSRAKTALVQARFAEHVKKDAASLGLQQVLVGDGGPLDDELRTLPSTRSSLPTVMQPTTSSTSSPPVPPACPSRAR
jgi:acyl-CoA synthetase (AMP-forming)/AMP-acid ligase II